MKAHELARLLLEGPDIPVVISVGEMGDLEEITDIYPYKPGDRSLGWEDGDSYERHDEPALELS